MIDFTSLKNRIMGTAETAGKKAGDMVELTKMRMQVAQYKGELAKAHEKLGAMIYNMMKVEEEDTSAINVCIDEIDYILDKIQEAEEKVKELRKVSCCQSCGLEIPSDACFCPKCGAKVEHPEPAVAVQETAEAEEASACEEPQEPDEPCTPCEPCEACESAEPCEPCESCDSCEPEKKEEEAQF